jgi:hypothetical protein
MSGFLSPDCGSPVRLLRVFELLRFAPGNDSRLFLHRIRWQRSGEVTETGSVNALNWDPKLAPMSYGIARKGDGRQAC